MHEDVIALPARLQVRRGKRFPTLAEALAPGDQAWCELPVGEPVGEEDGEQPGEQENGGEQHVESLVHIYEQQRKIAEQPVPSLQELHAEADHQQHQEQHERFDAARAGVGEDEHKQRQRHKRDAKPGARMEQHLTTVIGEHDGPALQVGEQGAAVAVGPHHPPVDEVGMLIDFDAFPAQRGERRRRSYSCCGGGHGRLPPARASAPVSGFTWARARGMEDLAGARGHIRCARGSVEDVILARNRARRRASGQDEIGGCGSVRSTGRCRLATHSGRGPLGPGPGLRASR
jgi:hypothetical protein